MRGCITLIILVGSAMVAVTYLGAWMVVLLVGALAALALMGLGHALTWIGRHTRGVEIGEEQVFERPDSGVRPRENHTRING